MMDRENLQRPADQAKDGGAPADEMGKLSFTEDQTVYTGSSHWTTMLEDVPAFSISLLPLHLD